MRKFTGHYLPFLITVAAVALGSVSISAQEWSSDQLEVWRNIEERWEASTQKEDGWVESFLHPEYQGWSHRLSMPVNRPTFAKGIKLDSENTKTQLYQLDPVRISVQKGGAVVHYYYLWFYSYMGEQKVRQDRMTEFFVKESGRWLLLGSHSSEAGGHRFEP